MTGSVKRSHRVRQGKKQQAHRGFQAWAEDLAPGGAAEERESSISLKGWEGVTKTSMKVKLYCVSYIVLRAALTEEPWQK